MYIFRIVSAWSWTSCRDSQKRNKNIRGFWDVYLLYWNLNCHTETSLVHPDTYHPGFLDFSHSTQLQHTFFYSLTLVVVTLQISRGLLWGGIPNLFQNPISVQIWGLRCCCGGYQNKCLIRSEFHGVRLPNLKDSLTVQNRCHSEPQKVKPTNKLSGGRKTFFFL